MASRAESALAVNIKKATNSDETSPKRKHVRACIVYTWDYQSSRAFWNGLKIQPLQEDEVQIFKALITIHKVLQEGHPKTLIEAQSNLGFIQSLGKIHGNGTRGYGRLIREYVAFLMRKLSFHKTHPEFNGTFEYEEYVSLKSISDPNEGFETIMDLMSLQDAIDDFQRLVFASISNVKHSECKVSALVPMVAESYGIYRFITSMMRALHHTTGSDEALEPLRQRYNSEHMRLRDFYSDCSTIRYLTSLITIPKLRPEPPNLFQDDEDSSEFAPSVPKRPGNEERVKLEREDTPLSSQMTASSAVPSPEPVTDFWSQQQAQQAQQAQQQYQEEQRRLQQEQQAALLQQQQLAMEQQRQFEEMQRQQMEAQKLAQEKLMQEQLQQQTQGRVAELERDLLNFRGQYEQDQLLLQQYDQRVKSLENELQQLNLVSSQQFQSKDELINTLQDKINQWQKKYEALAKLYSQLRKEHIELLNKMKTFQQRAASAQEAIEKKEKMEKDMKAKNMELADLIRERDRARYELDKLRGGQKDEVERLERELSLVKDQLAKNEKSSSSNVMLLLNQHQKEVEELQKQLADRDAQLKNLSTNGVANEDLNELLKEKEEELEIMQATMDNALKELAEQQKANEEALDEQIDQVLIEQLNKLAHIIDSVLLSGAKRVQDSIYELDSPMQAGNMNSSPSYLLSVIEKASNSATDFATAFNNFIADGPNSDHSQVIENVTLFSSGISELVLDSKGITRMAKEDDESDMIISLARNVALSCEHFFTSLTSDKLKGLSDEEKTDKVIVSNMEVQENLQQLMRLTEKMVPKSIISSSGSKDLGELVDSEMEKAAQAIKNASERLTTLLAKPKDPSISTIDLQVNQAILAAAIAVTNAIALLIKAATECQTEIVAQGKGTNSRAAFYRKHNRWTEGLISAAKAVAASTNILIETADGVLSASNTPEQLIVASNEVAASTAQLVAASRVKATFMSKTQDKLEYASKAVTSACRSLVNQVKDILAKKQEEEVMIDYSKLTPHEFKTTEMEQQVEILKLENSLAAARKRLGEIRKFGYQDDSD